jgi:threonine synthase
MDHMICLNCQETYSLDDPRWRCDCGGLLDIEFTPTFDLEQISLCASSMWRFRGALPLPDDAQIISLDEGNSPLTALMIGEREVLVKQEQLFPTGSYKDRGVSLMITKAAQLGIQRVVEDSSGNAGCAVAAYCAKAGIECDIYVPASASLGKLAQIGMYGAHLHRIPGSREDTAQAVMEAAQSAYYASHSWNPFFFHGTKTFAYEICEQLGWEAPDTLVLPAGNGTLLLGAWIGFNDLLKAGIIQHLPKLVAVQAAACPPLFEAFVQGRDEAVPVEQQPSLAEGIAIVHPVRGAQMLAAVRQSGGTFLVVSEAEISAALQRVARQGHYIEPTSAAIIAGVEQYVRTGADEDTIVTAFTGHGLKATETMMKMGIRDKSS